MKIAEGVEMLEISSNIGGNSRAIYPTLIWDKDTMILVDAGFPGQLPQLREAVEKAGAEFDQLKIIIITHHDIDHIGGLAAILKDLPEVEVFSHEEEKPYINGEKPSLKLAGLEARLDSLPENMKAMYEKMKAAYQGNQVDVDRTLLDGEELPYCGWIKIIFTPGHTLGHICLYLKQSKTLIAGDFLRVEGENLTKADPSINFDNDQIADSLKILTEYDIETVICYHGGSFNGNVNQRIAELAE